MNSASPQDTEKVSAFFSQLVIDMMDGKGISVNVLAVPGVIAAGKRLGNVETGKKVTVDVLRRIETAHPEIWDLLLVGASEVMKERIRRALSPRKDIDVPADN